VFINIHSRTPFELSIQLDKIAAGRTRPRPPFAKYCDMPQAPPIWTAIAHSLRSEYWLWRLWPLRQAPTESALAARGSGEQHTVRHAIKARLTEGLSCAARLRGVFGDSTPTDYHQLAAVVRFHAELHRKGRIPGKEFPDAGNPHRNDPRKSSALAWPRTRKVAGLRGAVLC